MTRGGLAAAPTLALATAIVTGTGAAQPPSAPLPERLSATGLYLPGTRSIDPNNRPFSPQYPLWTDGADKSRWIRLPTGGRIAGHDADAWEFPVGTRLWKEFAFGGRKVETRMLWRTGVDTWAYAAYLWDAAQTDARLVPAEGLLDVADIAPGKRHSVPSREDCRTCHESGAGNVLGFSALQLSTARDPAAPHGEALQPGMVTLRSLVDEHLIEAPPGRYARPPRIPGDDRTRAVLGYLSANCGHCHHERSSIATARFPLRMPAYATPAQIGRTIDGLVARTTKWDLPHSTPGTTAAVRPGAPDLSALLVRMRSRRPSTQMPPLGTAIADHEAVDMVSAWIKDLARRDDRRAADAHGFASSPTAGARRSPVGLHSSR
jgi:hypothetical protein